MRTVNSEIKRILKAKEAGIASGVVTMRDLLKELQGQVMGELGKAAVGSWDAYALKQMLNTLELNFADFDSRAKKELGTLMDGSWEKGISLVDEPLKISGQLWTGFNVSSASLDVLKDFSFTLIGDVTSSTWTKIKGEISLGVMGGKTPHEVATAIGKSLKDKSIFRSTYMRAEAITKLEMGRVFSRATQERMSVAAQHVEGLEKEWKHAGHPKQARPTHLMSDGLHVPVDEPFLIGGVLMMHPRDPAAPIGEVIHCGCDHVPWHSKWKKAA